MNDNGAVTNYSPNALNQYTSTTGNSFSYDNNFNLTHSAGFNGVYDAANRLVSASNGGSGEAQTTVVGFVYDGLGRCVKRTFNGVATVFVYDGWKPIGEFDECGYFQAWSLDQLFGLFVVDLIEGHCEGMSAPWDHEHQNVEQTKDEIGKSGEAGMRQSTIS